MKKTCDAMEKADERKCFSRVGKLNSKPLSRRYDVSVEERFVGGPSRSEKSSEVGNCHNIPLSPLPPPTQEALAKKLKKITYLCCHISLACRRSEVCPQPSPPSFPPPTKDSNI